MGTERFDFAFDDRYRRLLGFLGVTHRNSWVEVTDDAFRAKFGPWSWETPTDNIVDVRITRHYRAYRAIGARGSFADRGLTFGTNTHEGVCVCVREPIPGLLPLGMMKHPGITVTVDRTEELYDTVRERAGLDEGRPG